MRSAIRRQIPHLTALVLVLLLLGSYVLAFGWRSMQFVVNGVVIGSYFVLGAIGLSLIYGIRNFANFAHGELIALGAYVALTLNNLVAEVSVNIVVAGLVAAISVALVGLFLEVSIFRRLEGKPVSMLIASVGLFFIIQNLIRAIWSTDQRLYDVQITTVVDIGGGLVMTPVQVATLGIALVLVTTLHIVLRYTKVGKAMRATADSLMLAKVTGINTRLVALVTWILAGGFAAVAGVLLGLNTVVRPTMGFDILLFLFAAVILGGIGSPYGALLGGFLIGISNEVSKFLLATARIDSAYSPAVVFAILVTTLLLRPTGLLSGEPLWPGIARAFRRIGGVFAAIRGG